MIPHYRVLGPARVLRSGGQEASLGGARLRALLTALAVDCGRTVTVGQLISQVWGPEEEPPADAVKALQALVGRLRRTLGHAAVTSAPGGYLLAADPDDVDLHRFERLTVEGSAASTERDPARAVTLFDEALSLWAGPALLDLPGRTTDPLAVRMERLRETTHRNRLAAQVALGRADSALGEIAELAAENPLDEPLQALHLRALHAAGRTAQALAAYEDVRAGLAERLGTDPGAELRVLHRELLRPSPNTTPETPAEAPPEPLAKAPTAPDVGARAASGSPEAARPPVDHSTHSPAPGARALGRVRAPLTSFVGRESELQLLARELQRQRLVTLLGPGGVGKTRLAIEAARAGRETSGKEVWQDGVWVAELAPVRDAETVPETVLTALGARETTVRGPGASTEELQPAPRDPLAQLVEHCRRRRLLLVLDNCEHLVGAAAELVHLLLTECPGVTVLATSREPLGVPGETVRPVEPLPPDVALRLLAVRGAAARPGFRVQDDPDACAEICLRLDGLPLAVELAAARLRLLTARQLADRLDDRFRLLGRGSGSRTALPRQQTLRAVVDWSWDLLDEAERTVLRRLAVFSGGCAVEQAEDVCGAGTLETLASLVDKSLVVATPEGAERSEGEESDSWNTGRTTTSYAHEGMRYRLLETVAEYAAERLAEAGERESVARRHLTAYRELLRVGEPELRGPQQVGWLGRFEREHDNVRTALRTAVELGAEQDGLCLALSMSWFWQLRGHQADARIWSSAVAALGPDPFEDPVRVAVPLEERCTGRPPPWDEDQLWEARRGVRLLVQATSPEGDADALTRTDTQAYLRRVVAAYHSGMPQVSRQPGSVWYFARLMTGEFADVEETMNAVVRDIEGLGERWREGHAWELGFTYLMRARLAHDRTEPAEAAAGDADRALAYFERADNPWGIAESLAARGEEHARRERYAEAAADLERAMAEAGRIGAHHQVPLFKARLADVRLRIARDEAERAEAEGLLREAAREADRFGGEPVSTARLLLVQHYGGSGRTGRAREELTALERSLPSGVSGLFEGELAGQRAWLDCLDGRFEQAAKHVGRAVRGMESVAYLVAPWLVSDQFLVAAWAKARLGAGEDGARLLGAYDGYGLSGSFGLRPFPDAGRMRSRAEAELRAALGSEAYEAAHARGTALSIREAAALV
ncbi:BTAD domain-containing putative transcriptional regulator [Streptomyces sp. B-S-A8]|uniref:BTAD domain-containing putative transcriptional regulator n=1 Tax=Streptomyces solicavernae TaxID=3043614 RepID=A0ABT6RT25_9ACTN|nr:BTAD domain-containing putative transcriptional regulator [Streptomyces sp. B-S-A8]MDI3387369.1 BTAD domain-containing putative transcriptional regulator [Streptomyces sp. B-S-A8]